MVSPQTAATLIDQDSSQLSHSMWSPKVKVIAGQEAVPVHGPRRDHKERGHAGHHKVRRAQKFRQRGLLARAHPARRVRPVALRRRVRRARRPPTVERLRPLA